MIISDMKLMLNIQLVLPHIYVKDISSPSPVYIYSNNQNLGMTSIYIYSFNNNNNTFI